MILARQIQPTPERKRDRIGLALSGGGFRASIFHLGVIRRLEELGIMPYVDVISAVSGGSIIAAYYVCEMERLLRLVPSGERMNPDVRIKQFKIITKKFFEALDNNLRSRALIFTPFYHPVLFIKTLLLKTVRSTARSELIQKEFDKWFYFNNTLDQLPSAGTGCNTKDVVGRMGPKVLLNTTSLLTGERVTYLRVPISRVNEMSKVDSNVLPLSRVVGASSGVPGLFPPTLIAGDVLVDGGVADNQGIESLLKDPSQCTILIVSDASGQMEQLNTIGRSTLTVIGRVNSVLQFQVRNKLLDLLVGWKHLAEMAKEERSFAFIHLFLNLKDCDEVTERVSSEYIAAIGRIRTDLDQFSYIEREALMYHGYTLIDAQLRKYCDDRLSGFLSAKSLGTMWRPPLFREDIQQNEEARKLIRADLEAGAQNVYLVRCAIKYPKVVAPILVVGTILAVLLLLLLFFRTPEFLFFIRDSLFDLVLGLLPMTVQTPLNNLLISVGLLDLTTSIRGLSGFAALIVLLLLALYVVSYPVFTIVRRITIERDKLIYKKVTGVDPLAEWNDNADEHK